MRTAAPAIDRLLERLVALLEKAAALRSRAQGVRDSRTARVLPADEATPRDLVKPTTAGVSVSEDQWARIEEIQRAGGREPVAN